MNPLIAENDYPGVSANDFAEEEGRDCGDQNRGLGEPDFAHGSVRTPKDNL